MSRSTSSERSSSASASKEPSERASRTPINADTAISARTLGLAAPLRFEQPGERLDQPPGQVSAGSLADLRRGVRAHQSLQHRPRTLDIDPDEQPLDVTAGIVGNLGALGVGVLGGDGRQVEADLAAEVARDQCGIDAGVVTDVADGRLVEAALAEEGLRRSRAAPRGWRSRYVSGPDGCRRSSCGHRCWRSRRCISKHQAGAAELGLLFHLQGFAGIERAPVAALHARQHEAQHGRQQAQAGADEQAQSESPRQLGNRCARAYLWRGRRR